MSDQPKKRGRPPAEEQGLRLSVWVYSRQFDALSRVAQRRDMSMSSLVRDMLVKAYPSLDRDAAPTKKTA